MDRLRAMTVFVAVSDAGSLSGAARQLDEPLTNVSRLLSQLEDHVGVKLIERTTRRLLLTPEGRTYLAACRRVLDDVQGVENTMAGLANVFSGDISITAPVGLGRLHIVPAVAEFLSDYPQINVRLLLADRIVDLMGEEIDVAVRVGKMRDSELRAQRVGSLRLVACAAPGYVARRGAPASVAALCDHDCVTFAELPGGSRWIFSSKRHGRHAVRVRSRLNVNTADAAVGSAVAGVGIARVLSYQAQAALEAKLLEPVLQSFDDVAIPVTVVSRPSRLEAARVRAFVRSLSTQLRARLGASG